MSSSLGGDSVGTTEGSLSDKGGNDERFDELSEGCVPEENIALLRTDNSENCDVGHINSNLPVTAATDELPITNASRNLQLEPEIGMVFHSEDEAYVFYNTYAFKTGFSVRKGHLGRRKDGTIRDRVFLCSNEGIRQKHRTHETKKPRANVRTNCLARIDFKVDPDQLWVVNKVIYEHNHPLTPPTNAHLLRSHRKLMAVQEDTDDIDECGVIPTTVYDISVEETHDTGGGMFPVHDRRTYLQTNRTRDLDKGDAHLLLNFLSSKQLEDPSFFYAVQLDVNEQVTNFFWVDARSRTDYSCFGDVVAFDTTYRATKNNVPFAPFIGVNHHKQVVVFGSAFLLDETTESFIWLFKNFMIAMSGQQPKTIFTDQCAAMSRAISVIFPNTSHRLCLWHLFNNSMENISSCFSGPNFQKDFRNCIYESDSEENFDTLWRNLVSDYDLENNLWLEELYASREKWALVYRKDTFCATMVSMQWGDVMKSHFRKYFNRKLPLSKFLEQYKKSMIQLREKELFEDYQSRQTKPVLLVDTPILNEAAESFTRQIYMDFEHEFKSQLLCFCEHVGMDGTVYTFRVSLSDKHHFGLVEFNPANFTVSCSCKKFETVGILCMHSLKVLNTNNVLHLPPQYLVKRWTKYANVGMAFDTHQSSTDGRETMALQYNRVCHKAVTIATKSAFSEDSLEIFEHELDSLALEVEHILRNDPSKRQDIAVEDDMRHNMLETTKKVKAHRGPPKDANEKRKRKPQTDSSSSGTTVPQTTQGKVINLASGLMVSDSSHCPPYQQDGATSYGSEIPVQSCSTSTHTSYRPEMRMTTRGTFVPSQGLYGHAIASQGTGNLKMRWSRGSTSVSMPFMPGQTNNFSSWVVQPRTGLNVDMPQNHSEQSI